MVLPSQHLTQRGRAIAEPQRRLMLAVLQTVVDDVQDAAGYDGADAAPSYARAYWQALAYVESRDRSWPFSFENICETIGLDADGIRRTLRRGPAAIRLDAEASPALSAQHENTCPRCAADGSTPGGSAGPRCDFARGL